MILLELFCSFGSAHERAATFQDCRNGKLPQTLLEKNSLLLDIGKLILACTNNDTWKRPTASEIVKLDLFNESKIAHLQEIEIEKLEEDLATHKALVELQKCQIKEKDEEILKLQKELQRFQNT